MPNKKEILTLVGGIVAFFAVLMFLISHSNRNTYVGGVAGGNEYSYSTTTGSFSSASSTMIRLGGGTLGSVNIGTVSANTFVIKDATSTTDIASTTLFSAQASLTGSYQLDVTFNRGLFIDFPASFVGRYTVTYR